MLNEVPGAARLCVYLSKSFLPTKGAVSELGLTLYCTETEVAHWIFYHSRSISTKRGGCCLQSVYRGVVRKTITYLRPNYNF